jgi:endonuclease YncB( thermonuclease family)
MPYKLIEGQFHIHYSDRPRSGPEPDGDTLKFLPDNPVLVEDLHRSGPGPDFNGRNMINLRFDAIDALETHFSGMHQNEHWAEAARDVLLREVGFGDVHFFADLRHKVESVQHHPRCGYIYARTLDSHGRIVAFVYTGDSAQVDGADVFVNAEDVERSLNAHLLREGLVYPSFYTTLPVDLKASLAALSVEARQNRRGLWADATGNMGQTAEIGKLPTLEELVIWPKLFRRLARYFASGYQGLAEFESWLRADPVHRDDRVILPNMELGNIHDVIEITGNRVRMVYEPEEIIILPDDALTVAPPGPTLVEPRDIRIIAALVNPVGREAGLEKVTLLNPAPQAADLDGWVIADRANGRQVLQGTLEAGALTQVPMSQQVRLSNRGDSITLFDSAGRQIDQVSYSEREGQREGWTVIF